MPIPTKDQFDAALLTIRYDPPTKDQQRFDQFCKESDEFKDMVAKTCLLVMSAPPQKQLQVFLTAMAWATWVGVRIHDVVEEQKKPRIITEAQ